MRRCCRCLPCEGWLGAAGAVVWGAGRVRHAAAAVEESLAVVNDCLVGRLEACRRGFVV